MKTGTEQGGRPNNPSRFAFVLRPCELEILRKIKPGRTDAEHQRWHRSLREWLLQNPCPVGPVETRK